MYLRGEGVAQNAIEAFRLFQLAADQGHTGARIMLGSMYAEGIGTKRDLEAAYMWLSAASLAGDQRGRDRLSALEASLTPSQVSEARERAQQLQIGRRQLTARALAQ
jgi:TPR repeat protein